MTGTARSNPAPAGLARPILRHVATYSATSFAYQAALLLRSVVAARLLGPSLSGLWDALALIPAYNVTHLGVLQGVQRDIPLARGRGQAQRVEQLRDQGLWAALVPSLGLAALTVLAVLSLRARLDPALTWGLAALAALLVLQQLQGLTQILLSADNRFDRLGAVQLATGAAALAGLGLVARLGWAGQLWSAPAIPLVFTAVGLAGAGYRLRLRLRPALYAEMIRTGLPIALLVLADALLVGVDRFIILSSLGPAELGYFRVAVLATAFVAFIPTVVNQVLYPRLSEQFAAAGAGPAVRRLFAEPLLALAHLLPLSLGLAWLLLPAATARFLPAFTPGVSPARIVLLGAYFSTLFGTIWSVLIVRDRQLELLGWVLLAVALKAGLTWALIQAGLGLLGAALAALLAYTPYGLTLFFRSAALLDVPARRAVELLAGVLAPYALGVALSASLGLLAAGLGNGEALQALAAVLFLVAYAPLAQLSWLRRPRLG